MVSKPKITAKGKSTGKKPARPRAKPGPSVPKRGAEKPQSGVPAPVEDKVPGPAVPVGDKTPASPTLPVGVAPPGDASSQLKEPEPKQRFRVGRPSNPYLALHPPPRLGRRR